MKSKFTKGILGVALAAIGSLTATASIPSGYTITPGNNATVTTLDVITLTKSNEYYLETYINRSIRVNGETIAIQQEANRQGTMITMTLTSPVTKSGTYEVVIPAGNFTYGLAEIDNPEISWTVIVDNPNQPDIPSDVEYTLLPENNSTLVSLETLTIDFTGATAVAVNPDVEGAKVTLAGKEVETELAYAAGASASQIAVNLEPGINVSGSCTVTLPAGLFSVTLDGETMESPEIKATYTIDAPPTVGDSFMDGKLKFIITSIEPNEVAVTWTNNEADYNGINTVPTTASYKGITYDVTSIGRLAFSFVTGISDFTVPEGITKIDWAAFSESSLRSISLPSTLVELGESAFDTCQSLESITIPANVTIFGSDILYGCTSLKSVNLPEGMTRIPTNFMPGCVMVTSLNLPSTIKEIGEFAFSECEKLSDITLPDGITTLERFCFAYCPDLTKLDIPESVTTMGHGVFYQAGLLEASLPENITVIPDGTFQCCASLPSFVIGNNVVELEQEVFYWCFELKDITFGEKVAKIGEKVFYGDQKIENVICLNPEPAEGAEFENAVYQNATLTVPSGSLDAYKSAEGWKNFVKIQEQTSGIDNLNPDNVETEYFNMRGLRVNNPVNGEVVIMKRGSKVTREVYRK